MTDSSTPLGVAAHVLRRTTFGPPAGEPRKWASQGIPALLEWVLNAPPLPIAPGQAPPFDADQAWRITTDGWMTRMARADAGIHEKMVWFWHGHLTTSHESASATMMWLQHDLIRRMAMGNFRELMQAITLDPGMLVWLDGDSSDSAAPNENYARELMELFTLGRGHYTESDVRQAALGLSGYSVEWQSARVSFDPARGPQRPIALLGRQGFMGAEQVVDVVCDHEACAPFIADKLYRFFMGFAPTRTRLGELASNFRRSGLEIRPLVTDIVTHPDFLGARGTRPRTPIEWLVASAFATDNQRSVDPFWGASLDQVPLRPPNPAGWPDGPIWLSSNQYLQRARIVEWFELRPGLLGADPVAGVIERCSLFEPSESTLAVFRNIVESVEDPWQRTYLLFASALTSPEFSIA